MQTIRVHVPEENGMVLPIQIELVPAGTASEGPTAEEQERPVRAAADDPKRLALNELRAPRGFLA